MRKRDYIRAMPGEGVRAARAEVLAAMIDHHNAIDTMIADALPGHSDPMSVVRSWHGSNVALSGMVDEISRSSIDRIWRTARVTAMFGDTSKLLKWKAAAVGFNPDSRDLDIALSGMTPLHDGDRWNLAIALPAPPPMSGPDHKHIITEMVLIDPLTGVARLYGDSGDVLVEPYNPVRYVVHADARTWARDFATARVEWMFARHEAQRVANITPSWLGLPPTALLIGNMRNVRWPHINQIIAGAGIDPRKLQFAIYDQTAAPRVHKSGEAA